MYSLSDFVVNASEVVTWLAHQEIEEFFLEEHTLLDDFYHDMQKDLAFYEELPISGRDLFEMSSISYDIADFDTTMSLIKFTMQYYKKIMAQICSLSCETEDIW